MQSAITSAINTTFNKLLIADADYFIQCVPGVRVIPSSTVHWSVVIGGSYIKGIAEKGEAMYLVAVNSQLKVRD